ncbi:hypothetical protein [Actinoplanes sp. NPDC048796]
MPAEVLFDPAAAYPEAGIARTAMAARDWEKPAPRSTSCRPPARPSRR